MGKRPIILTTAGAIVLDKENRVLMQHRGDNDLWGLPGGAVELGETVEETAIREVLEETGLNISNLNFFNIYSGEGQHYIYPNGDEVYFICITYYTRDYKGEIQIDGVESKEIRFFNINDLPSNIAPTIIYILDELRYKLNNNLL